MSSSGFRIQVVDASAIAQLYLGEKHAAAVENLLFNPSHLDVFIAPSIIASETAAAITRKLRRKEFSVRDARQAFAAWRTFLDRGLLRLMPANELLDDAFDLSISLHHGLHDCLYLALARRQAASLITCDGVLAGKAKSLRLAVDLVK